MYAVIETGGKQFKAVPGEAIQVETLAGEVGAAVQFDRVLAVIDAGEVKSGQGAVVHGTIAEQDRGQKTLVFKFKRKKQYKRTIGHRQNFTRVNITEIV